MQAEQRRLLESYDCVLAVDVDELVCPDPRWGTLDEYLAGFTEDFVNCLGYEVIHLRDREPPYRPGRRSWSSGATGLLLTDMTSPRWQLCPWSGSPGFMGAPTVGSTSTPTCSWSTSTEWTTRSAGSAMQVAEWEWNENDLEGERGTHNRITDPEEFDRWFYTEGCFEHGRIVIERIPERWRGRI